MLQRSWLSGINKSAVADQRVKAVVAVSPPLRLLFEPSSSTTLSAKELLISGTHNWVVPSIPVAISTHARHASCSAGPSAGALERC